MTYKWIDITKYINLYILEFKFQAQKINNITTHRWPCLVHRLLPESPCWMSLWLVLEGVPSLSLSFYLRISLGLSGQAVRDEWRRKCGFTWVNFGSAIKDRWSQKMHTFSIFQRNYSFLIFDYFNFGNIIKALIRWFDSIMMPLHNDKRKRRERQR